MEFKMYICEPYVREQINYHLNAVTSCWLHQAQKTEWLLFGFMIFLPHVSTHRNGCEV